METRLSQMAREDRKIAAEMEAERQREDRLMREAASRLDAQNLPKWAKPVSGISGICQNCQKTTNLFADSPAKRNDLRLCLGFDVRLGNLINFKCGDCGYNNTVVLGEMIHGSPSDFTGPEREAPAVVVAQKLADQVQ